MPVKVITDHAALTRLTNGKNLSSRMIRWVLKLAEFKTEWQHRFGTQNVVANVLSRNPVESTIEEQVNCAIIRNLVLSSREQLIEKQRKDPELGHIYSYLENPKDSSVNRTIGIRHVKTVVYRPKVNRTERVNRDPVQMIGNYVNDHHDTWDQFLREFANGSRYKSNCFEGVRLRSNESDFIRNNESCERREIREKVTGLKEDQGEKHTSIASKCGPLIPVLGQN
ncbi:retrovirus-related Pol polyprotein from transposon 297 [Trichonephila clavipes]|nr:retrovirus-related Pol polyprotein from transposon 297 [Trichonephila clavipes]